MDEAGRAMAAGPEDVVRLLLAWDTAGSRFEPEHSEALDRIYCYIPEENCMSEEPGWDVADVVRGYSIRSFLATPDSAVVEVSFDRLGYISLDGFVKDTVTQVHTLWLKSLNGDWRIVNVESQMGPHLSRSVAYRKWAGAVSDSAALAAKLGVQR
jgi:hypothetical protein